MEVSTTLGCVVAEKMAYGCTGILLAIEANGLGSSHRVVLEYLRPTFS